MKSCSLKSLELLLGHNFTPELDLLLNMLDKSSVPYTAPVSTRLLLLCSTIIRDRWVKKRDIAVISGLELSSLCLPDSTKYKITCMALLVINYIPPHPRLLKANRCKSLVDLSLFQWKMFYRTRFLSSRILNFEIYDPPRHVDKDKTLPILSYPIRKKKVPRVNLLPTKSQKDAFPTTTNLTSSSLGLSIMFSTYPYKLHFLQLNLLLKQPASVALYLGWCSSIVFGEDYFFFNKS